jgi:hypothetical protein
MSINFYETLKKKKPAINPNFERHGVEVPFRMLIAAPSGAGKTHSLCRLIYEMGKTFHEIYICVLSSDEPLYNMIVNRLPEGKVKIFEKGEVPTLDQFSHIDPKTKKVKRNDKLQRLIVFDDLMLCRGSNKTIEDYYTRGRKIGFSMIYIAQNYYAIPRNVRVNCQYFIIGRNILSKDIKDILRIFTIDMDLKDFTKLYNIITENPLDTMLINVHKKVISRNIVEEQYDVSNLMNIQNVLANL